MHRVFGYANSKLRHKRHRASSVRAVNHFSLTLPFASEWVAIERQLQQRSANTMLHHALLHAEKPRKLNDYQTNGFISPAPARQTRPGRHVLQRVHERERKRHDILVQMFIEFPSTGSG